MAGRSGSPATARCGEGYSEIPDLHFNIELLMADPPYIASRLRFTAGRGHILGLAVNGKRVSFDENVFYESGARRSRGLVDRR